MNQKVLIKKNLYYDSVSLMQLSEKIKSLPQVSEAVIVMGTDSNKNLLREILFFQVEIEQATSNDLVIAIKADNEAALESAIQLIEKNLMHKDTSEKSMNEVALLTQNSAYRANPEINLVLISTPGQYAALEAKKALIANKHVMIFSDNVSIEDEIELKQMADSKGLLLMGPDCGTAMINGVPLGFVNSLPKGPIGVIAASGTGSQEVSSLIAKLGSGITQLIGTGGRDLSEKVGGTMMMMALEALNNDNETKVIVLISKPPSEVVAQKLISACSKIKKPVVICFLGSAQDKIKQENLYFVQYLEEAAIKAVELISGRKITIQIDDFEELVESETSKMDKRQKYIRGLYTGGTLCDEALILLNKEFGNIFSNIALDVKYKLKNSFTSTADTLVDLGDDEFTRGRAHPMIDPQLRYHRLINEADDEEVGIVLMDFVLGYGSNSDPAGSILEAIKIAKEKFARRNQYLSIICTICGTETDPQGFSQQKNKLEQAGVICMPSNLQAVKLAAAIKRRLPQ